MSGSKENNVSIWDRSPPSSVAVIKVTVNNNGAMEAVGWLHVVDHLSPNGYGEHANNAKPA